MKAKTNNPAKFQKWAIALYLLGLFVILWGAWVRISHSGDGCGESWPLCHGEVIPQAEKSKTWIEFAHRLSSGLFGILIFGVTLWVWRVVPKKTSLWWAGTAMLVLTITEALLGARLVLAGLVGQESSVQRLLTMCLHLVNSLFLMAAIVAFYEWSRTSFQKSEDYARRYKKYALWFLGGFVLIASTGAIAALAGTVFPSTDLLEAIKKDFMQSSHFLLKLRIWHPFLATLLVGLALVIVRQFSQENRFLNLHLWWVLIGGVSFGYATLLSLSPVWMKLVHLFWAYLIWSMLVSFFCRIHRSSFESKE